MTSMEEFAFIASQLEWLEAHLRAQAPPAVGETQQRLDSALNALTCAQAVISELAHLRVAAERGPVALTDRSLRLGHLLFSKDQA